MGTYAANTTVDPAHSKAEIERCLTRYGADALFSGYDGPIAFVCFRVNGLNIRFDLEMPDRNMDEFTKTDTGKIRKAGASFKSWEQACRQRWRALALVIKAKLEAVECGITDFQTEFLPQILMPSGRTVATEVMPLIAKAHETGKMPKTLLPGLPAPKVEVS